MIPDVRRASDTLAKYSLYVSVLGIILGLFSNSIHLITLILIAIMLLLRLGILNKDKEIEATALMREE